MTVGPANHLRCNINIICSKAFNWYDSDLSSQIYKQLICTVFNELCDSLNIAEKYTNVPNLIVILPKL